MTTKHDKGKFRMELLPMAALVDVSKVLTFGAAKYGAGNWKTVPDSSQRYLGAALRHLSAWSEGERLDPESGLPHLAHAACNVLFLVWFETRIPQEDLENIPKIL